MTQEGFNDTIQHALDHISYKQVKKKYVKQGYVVV